MQTFSLSPVLRCYQPIPLDPDVTRSPSESMAPERWANAEDPIRTLPLLAPPAFNPLFMSVGQTFSDNCSCHRLRFILRPPTNTNGNPSLAARHTYTFYSCVFSPMNATSHRDRLRSSRNRIPAPFRAAPTYSRLVPLHNANVRYKSGGHIVPSSLLLERVCG